jgi:hypothetical protein
MQPVVEKVLPACIPVVVDVLRSVIPLAVQEFNTVRLPALEIAWGRPFAEEWATEDPKQRTQEVTKVYTRIINNVLYKLLKERVPTFQEYGTVGSDFSIDSVPFEDKNSFSTGDTWTGNGYKKTDWHLLKKYRIDETGRIIGCFAALVDLGGCASKWTDPTLKSNFSSLHIQNEDKDNLHLICGSVIPKKKFLAVEIQQI